MWISALWRSRIGHIWIHHIAICHSTTIAFVSAGMTGLLVASVTHSLTYSLIHYLVLEVRNLRGLLILLYFLYFHDLNLRENLVKCYIWSIALCGAVTGTVRAVDKRQLEGFEMWCWRRMENISWTDHVRNEEVLFQVNEQRNILHAMRKRKANWIGHVLRRNCLLKQVIEEKIKVEMEYINMPRKKILYISPFVVQNI